MDPSMETNGYEDQTTLDQIDHLPITEIHFNGTNEYLSYNFSIGTLRCTSISKCEIAYFVNKYCHYRHMISIHFRSGRFGYKLTFDFAGDDELYTVSYGNPQAVDAIFDK